MRRVAVRAESYPLKEPFVISRLTQETAEVVVVEIEEDGIVGRGECERADAIEPGAPEVLPAIEAVRGRLEAGLERDDLQAAMPRGPARAAVDCALWDLEAKRAGTPVWRLAGLAAPKPIVTAYTLSLGAPEAMATAARRNADRPLLKLKLGGAGDDARIAAVHAAAPEARLIVDANEAWTPALLPGLIATCATHGVELIEQPLPRGRDGALAHMNRPVPVCADESCLDRASLHGLAGRYDFINIKLDKAGGLSEALALAEAARAAGFGLMTGCMVGTSLAMAPALLVAGLAPRFVDLDGPLLLTRDREPGLAYDGSTICPADPALWG